MWCSLTSWFIVRPLNCLNGTRRRAPTWAVARHSFPAPLTFCDAQWNDVSDVLIAFGVAAQTSHTWYTMCVHRRGPWDETHEDGEEHRGPAAEPGRDHVQSAGDTDQPQVRAQDSFWWRYSRMADSHSYIPLTHLTHLSIHRPSSSNLTILSRPELQHMMNTAWCIQYSSLLRTAL